MKTNGQEPSLSQPSELSGDEPVLGGERRVTVCPKHATAMIRDLFGELLCVECLSEARGKVTYHTVYRGHVSTDPTWFTAGRQTPATHIRNVRAGLHPTGARLGNNPGATCGNCRHLKEKHYHSKAYWKCALAKDTNGPGTDIRQKWAGCEKWEPSEDDHE